MGNSKIRLGWLSASRSSARVISALGHREGWYLMEDNERRPGPESAAEYHRFVVADRQAGLIIGSQIGVDYRRSMVDFVCVVLEPGLPPVVVAESEIPQPGGLWEIRADGLWADRICEQPFVHWSYGLEAFALRVDSTEELLGRAVGERIPLGWELEIEHDGPGPENYSDYPSGYWHHGIAHGVLLFADAEREIEGPVLREHWWAPEPPPEVGLQRPTTRSGDAVTSLRVALPTTRFVWWLVVETSSVGWDWGPPPPSK